MERETTHLSLALNGSKLGHESGIMEFGYGKILLEHAGCDEVSERGVRGLGGGCGGTR